MLKQGDLVKKDGSVKTLRRTSREICRQCQGEGEVIHYVDGVNSGNEWRECSTCLGEGMVIVECDINIFPCKRKRKET